MIKLDEDENFKLELLKPIFKNLKKLTLNNKGSERDRHDLHIGVYLAFELHSSIEQRVRIKTNFPQELKNNNQCNFNDWPEVSYRIYAIGELINLIEN